MFRVVLGSLFAVVLVLIVQAALLPIKPPDAERTFFFFGVLGFLAGFSERFAQDLILETGGSVARRVNTAPQENDNASIRDAVAGSEEPDSDRANPTH
jgi:hypothetical protein